MYSQVFSLALRGSKRFLRAQGALERVRQEVLGQGRIAGPIGEKAEQRLGVFLVEPLEIIPPHHW